MDALAVGLVLATALPGDALVWDAHDGRCPTADEITARAEVLTRRPVTRSPLHVRFTAPDGEPSWRAEITTGTGTTASRRQLEAASCAELAEAVTVMMALAAPPPASGGGQGESSAAPDGELNNLAAPPPARGRGQGEGLPAPTKRLSSPPPNPLPRAGGGRGARRAPDLGSFALHVAATADGGTLPGPSAGVLAGAGWSISGFRYDLSFMLWPERRKVIRPSPEAGGDFTLIGAQARACWAAIADPVWEVAVCGTGEGGALHAEGFGVSDPGSSRDVWWAVGAEAAPAIEIGDPIWITGRVQALVPLTRPRFVLENVGEVHQAAVVSVRGAIGLEVRL